MLLSRKWLNEFVEVDASDREFAEAMTLSGSKQEATTDLHAELQKRGGGPDRGDEAHENSDHMWVCRWTWARTPPLQIVTGAWNIHVGDLVPVAQHKALLPGGVKIEKGKLRGVESDGMLCSLKELGSPRSTTTPTRSSGPRRC
jgi:phenylalanyl-tRNA synthetase beta chain